MNQIAINGGVNNQKQQIAITESSKTQKSSHDFSQMLMGLMASSSNNENLEELVSQLTTIADGDFKNSDLSFFNQTNIDTQAIFGMEGHTMIAPGLMESNNKELEQLILQLNNIIEPDLTSNLVEVNIVDQPFNKIDEIERENPLQLIWLQFQTLIQHLDESTNLPNEVSDWYNSLSKEQQSILKSGVLHILDELNTTVTKDGGFNEIITSLLKDSNKWSHFNEAVQRQSQSYLQIQSIDLTKQIDSLNQLNIFNSAIEIESEQNRDKKPLLQEDSIVPLDLKQLQVPNSSIGSITQIGSKNTNSNSYNLNLNNLPSELGNIIMKNVKLPNGVTEMKIQLHPIELGKIDVKLSAHQGILTAQLITETIAGKEILENHLHMLRQSLIHQGYQIERIEVQSTSNSSFLGQGFNEGFSFNHQFSNPNPKRQNGQFGYEMEVSNNEPIDDMTDEINLINAQSVGIDYTV